MIDLHAIPGATKVRNEDLPAALRDIVASSDAPIEAFTADDLPADVVAFLAKRPGMTVLFVDGRRSPVGACRTSRSHRVHRRRGRDLCRLRQAGDEPTAADAAAALRSALLELATTPAGRNRDVRLKARCAQQHLHASDLRDTWRAMIEAALATDAQVWGTGSAGH